MVENYERAIVYYLIRCEATGQHLAGAGGDLSIRPHADDDCVWIMEGDNSNSLRCVTSGLGLSVSAATVVEQWIGQVPGDTGNKVHLSRPDGSHLKAGLSEMLGCRPGVFTVFEGMGKLPSEHLREMEESGITIMERVLSECTITHLKEVIASRRAVHHAHESTHDGNFMAQDMLPETPAIGRAIVHPVAMWVLQKYLGTAEIHYAHQPVVQTLKPAENLLGTFPAGGWHSDYPYHGEHSFEQRLAVQLNICIDEFRKDNGGTQFLPMSHLLGKGPPKEWNEGGTRPGEGLYENVQQMEAPAGAAVLYDARMWHRACPEQNVSGHDRLALLNAVNLSYQKPLFDKTGEASAYVASSVPSKLTMRERQDLERMCVNKPAARPTKVECLQPVGVFSAEKGKRLDIGWASLVHECPEDIDTSSTRLRLRRLDGPTEGAVWSDHTVGIFSDEGHLRLDIGSDSVQKECEAEHESWATRLLIKKLEGDGDRDLCYGDLVGIFSETGGRRLDISDASMKQNTPADHESWATRFSIRPC